MDFIERWFGVAPDGGSGTLEISLIIAALIILGILFLRVKLRSTAYRSRKN